ncbi:MAG: hypothetical protein RL594_286 [Bacteroidota bacterium]|jgi:rhodanese-related sulfurtransferase
MLTVLLVSFLLGIAQTPVAEGGNLSPKQLAEMLRRDTTLIVVDVRTPEEHKQGHLRNSRLIDFYNAEFHAKLQTLPTNRTIVLYCRSGRRSEEAMKFLTSIGYSRVYHLHGGILAWKKERLTVVGP